MSENRIEVEIDDFEKLYAITSAEENAFAEVGNGKFKEENFSKICNFAKYKQEHPEQFSEKNRTPTEKDLNYYMIPISLKQKVRNGNEELEVEKEAHVLIDSSGHGLYIVMEDVVMPAKELQDEIEAIEEIYQEYIDQNLISRDDIEELINLNSLDDVANRIQDGEIRLEKIKEIVDEKIRQNGLKTKKILEEDNELDEKDRENPELENDLDKDKEQEQEEKEEEQEIAGVNPELIDMLAQRFNCKRNQISLRNIENLEKVQEDIGLNLKSERGKVIAVRINYGFQQRYYLVNKETGDRYITHRGDNGSIDEVKDYFRYPVRSGEDAKPLRKDEKRSYITYLDVNGNIKEMKYINNGKYNDMLRDERERYIAEVEIANENLKDAIEEYQQDNTHENWDKVKDAMRERVRIDKKYEVLANQKRVTIDTLEETKDETLRKEGPPRKDDDEWDPRMDPRDNRW